MKTAALVFVIFVILVNDFAFAQVGKQGPTSTAPASTEDLLAEGRAAFAKEDFTSAIAAFDRVIEQNMSLAVAYRERGLAKAGMDNPQGAIDDLTKALELDPNDAGTWMLRGNLYESLAWPMETKTFPEARKQALKDYDEALKRNSEFATGLVARGSFLLFSRQRDQGVEDFRRALLVPASLGERENIVTRLSHRVRARLSFAKHIEMSITRSGGHPEIVEMFLPEYTELAELCEHIDHEAKLIWNEEERLTNVLPVTSDMIKTLVRLADHVKMSLPPMRIGADVPQPSLARRMRVRIVSDYLYHLATRAAFKSCSGESLDAYVALQASLDFLGKNSGDGAFKGASLVLEAAGNNAEQNRQLRVEAARTLIVSQLDLAERWSKELRDRPEGTEEWVYPGLIENDPINRSAYIVWLTEKLDKLEADYEEQLIARLQSTCYLVSAESLFSLLESEAMPDKHITERMARLQARLAK